MAQFTFSKTRTFIIAEAGVNHNGDINLAHKLIEIAAKAKVDAIKFQTFSAEKVCINSAPKANYQIKNECKKSQIEMLRELELSKEEFKELSEHSKECGLVFMSTAFDKESLDFLVEEIGIQIIKVPSGEINNYDLLDFVNSKSLPTILSTGASTLDEIKAAVSLIASKNIGNNSLKNFEHLKSSPRYIPQKSATGTLAVLHCVSEYPAPYDEINLNCIHTLGENFPITVGYSDHSMGITVSLAAVAMGARVIEKHFTVSKVLPGPDHLCSIEPGQLNEMVESIRKIETSLGSFEKTPSKSEKSNLQIIRRSLVANKNIRKGEIFNSHNIAVKRPGTGMPASEYFSILGKHASKAYQPDDQLDESLD